MRRVGPGVMETAAGIRRGGLSPVEVTQQFLARIERLEPRLHAFITITAEQALEDAAQAEQELARGHLRGPLHGVPLAFKDVFDVSGLPTTGGSTVYRDRVAALDATVVRRLREAGAILLGKTNLDELAFGGPENPHYPPARNSWDVQRVPGGSSGGSAVAVVAGMVAGALGTDTAGSIRLPASFCGVVGLKPTFGRVSKAGVMPLASSFDHVGTLTQNVEDTALLLGVIAGYDPADAATVPVAVPDYAGELSSDVHGLRAGVLRPFFFDLLEDDVRASVEEALDVLRDLGVEVQDDERPLPIDRADGLGPWILTEAAHYHADMLAARPEDFGEDVLQNLRQPVIDGRTLVEGRRAMQALAEELRQRLEAVDVFVTPSTPLVAPLRGQETVELAGQRIDFRKAFVRCLSLFSAAHLPALSVPCGFDRRGLPIGLQIVGRPFDEQTMLDIGHAYERAAGWQLAPSGHCR